MMKLLACSLLLGSASTRQRKTAHVTLASTAAAGGAGDSKRRRRVATSATSTDNFGGDLPPDKVKQLQRKTLGMMVRRVGSSSTLHPVLLVLPKMVLRQVVTGNLAATHPGVASTLGGRIRRMVEDTNRRHPVCSM